MVNENTKTYQEEVFVLILHQLLATKQEERINSQILGVKG